MIENPSKDNLHPVIQFLATEGRQPMEIYTRIKAVYGDYSYSHAGVVEWCNKFRQGRKSTKDLACPSPARAVSYTHLPGQKLSFP